MPGSAIRPLGGDGLTKYLYRATEHRGPKNSQLGAKHPMPSPFKASTSQSTQGDVLKPRTPPLCTAAQFRQKGFVQYLLSIVIYKTKFGK